MDETQPKAFLIELLDCLRGVSDHLSKKAEMTQLKSDIDSGLVRRGGKLVPLDSMIHRLQLECHGLFVLEGYLILARQIISDQKNPLSYFSFRTLYEIAFKKINLLFAVGVTAERREDFSRIDTLSDLTGMIDQKNRDYFIKLLKEERMLLVSTDRNLFEQVEAVILSGALVKDSLLKKIRNLVNRKLANYIDISKLDEPDLLRGKSRLDSLNINWSHMLHGNPFMIKMIFEPKFKERQIMHLNAIIWTTAVNVLFRMETHVDDPVILAKIKDLLSQADAVWTNHIVGTSPIINSSAE